MKRTLLAGVTALVFAVSGQAFGQATKVEIAPDQRTKIKQYVVKEKVAPVTITDRVAVGTKLPAAVQLKPVPSDWGPTITRYNYVYHNNQVVLVDPSSREVVEIIN
jgi:hypothetical protein